MSRRPWWIGCVAVGLTGLTSCSADEYAAKTSVAPGAAVALAEAKTAEGAEPPREAPARALPRKIIYNAQVDLVVESLSATEADVKRLVLANGGYIAETEVNSYSHQRRTATWKVRVPVDQFDAFVTAVVRLGELNRNHLDSQDVSQEYYDLEARIANKQVEEKRLLKHLTDSTGKLEDILAVEREISRVRGEIEQGQGRLRYLANQTAMSTVTITASEIKDYTPPVSPTFGTQMGRTFLQSVQALIDFGKALALAVVALAPWLPLIVAAGLVLGWLARRARRRRVVLQPVAPRSDVH